MERLFAISDIHGCFKPFHELVTQTINLRKTDHLLLLGDYIDRGNEVKNVIDFIIDLKAKGFNITALTGNHEIMLLDSWHNPQYLPLWLLNDGRSTLESFGITDIRNLEEKYLTFFTSLGYYKIIGNLIFVHAGFNDEVADPFSDSRGMIWESRSSYRNPVFSDKIIIHGHRPKTISFVKNLIEEKSQVIPIDTGCVYGASAGYGYLSALELSSMQLYSVANTY